jgi:hypothetical protein
MVGAYNMGAKPIIVGTQLALSKIMPNDANYRYLLDSDYVKVGYVKTIGGFDTFVLPQVADWQNPYQTTLRDDIIYIISPSSQKLVKTALEGNTFSNDRDAFRSANLTQTWTMFKSWGTGIATNSVAAAIVLA